MECAGSAATERSQSAQITASRLGTHKPSCRPSHVFEPSSNEPASAPTPGPDQGSTLAARTAVSPRPTVHCPPMDRPPHLSLLNHPLSHLRAISPSQEISQRKGVGLRSLRTDRRIYIRSPGRGERRVGADRSREPCSTGL